MKCVPAADGDFPHYAEVPHGIQDKVVAQARANKEAAKEA